ncbi:TIGR04282 family arsenosugar biosynthesis glycosyltransferase [Flagellimonas myxillae]|uniref:TIGR04282 family arsenosugar biosynthesis glycosyltransferase n=1 Tax=Flagellimonas myxillae TaxID=2942214 RepID=UPI00201ED3A7|nr:DUF2064 domain-containing protein [Muricauda myxillae]MCL6266686.1 DUF2064 domain-containing protein [Muricauda myxillae]
MLKFDLEVLKCNQITTFSTYIDEKIYCKFTRNPSILANNCPKHIAVLLFANSAEEEVNAKKIGTSNNLFEALTQKAIKTVAATGLPYFHITEEKQQGHSFGQRFSNAIQHIFDTGYDHVITIGNDSPHLTKQHILEAAAQLSKNKVVLGPSLDGGFYLLGLHRSHFNAKHFESLPWQRASLYKKTKSHFESMGCLVSPLDVLDDIDAITDIKRLSNHVRLLGKKWIALFSSLLAQGTRHFILNQSPPKVLSGQIPFNKGSPFRFAPSI